jgi:hypothetical protein
MISHSIHCEYATRRYLAPMDTLTIERFAAVRYWRMTAVHIGYVTIDEEVPNTRRHEPCVGTMITWRFPLEEGACFKRKDGLYGIEKYATVRGGRIVDATLDEVVDSLDPTGAPKRHRRSRAWRMCLNPDRNVRVTFEKPHGHQVGDFIRHGYGDSRWWAVVEKVTARQAWLRVPSEEEVAAAGLSLA